MFPAAREDFRGSLRSAVANVSHLLLEQGEGDRLEAALRRSLARLPEPDRDAAAMLYLQNVL